MKSKRPTETEKLFHMSDLLRQQTTFSVLIARLVAWANDNGYAVTYGEAWRPDKMAVWYASTGQGIKNSLHRLKLAFDLNFFLDGKQLVTVEELRPLGTYWKTIHPLCRWGGDWTKPHPDADHFSMEWEGVK